MERVAIDTCVFFALLDYDKKYKEGGEKAVIDFKNEMKEKSEKYESNIRAFFHENLKFIKDTIETRFSEDLSLANSMKIINEKTNGKISTIKDSINRNHGILQNGGKEYYNKRDKEYKIKPYSEEELNEVREKLAKDTIELQKLTKFQQEFNEKIKPMYTSQKDNADGLIEDFDNYKDTRMEYQAGFLYEKLMKGEVELFVTSTSYDEILNHVASPEKTDPGFKLYAKEDVEDLAKKVVYLNTKDKEVDEFCQRLAALYRKNYLGGKQMAEDINSVGVYGDSLIMAECAIAGLNLITFNEKDFIYDLSDNLTEEDLFELDVTIAKNPEKVQKEQARKTKRKEEIKLGEKRKHIQNINKEFNELTSDALPITMDEFLNGEAKKSSEIKRGDITKIEPDATYKEFKQNQRLKEKDAKKSKEMINKMDRAL